MQAVPKVSASRTALGVMPDDDDDGDAPETSLGTESASRGWTQKEAHEILLPLFQKWPSDTTPSRS